MLGWIKKNRFVIIVTGLYFVVSAILVLNHEPWTDEANPYLIAKYINFSNFFEILRGEPHPILWTLLLAPFAKLGLPLIASHVISLVIMTVAVWLLVKYAPFPKWVKVMIALSAAFFYFNPVISRDYCLVPLAVVLTCMAYRDRFRHPIKYSLCIALLLQTHFLAAGLAAILYVGFFVEGLKRRVDARWMGCSVLVVGASVVLGFVCAIGSLMGQVIIQETMQCCDGVELPNLMEYFSSIDGAIFGTIAPVIDVTLGLALFYLWMKYRKQFWYLLVAVIVNLGVLSFIYRVQGNPQKDAINLLFFLAVFWMIHAEKPKNALKKLQMKIKRMATVQILRKKVPLSVVIFTLPFALSVPNALMASAYDLTQPFSGSRIMADYMNKNLPAGSVIVVPSYGALSALTVVAMELTEGRMIWDALNEEPLTYIDYTLPTRVESYVVSVEEIAEVVEGNFGDADNVYYLAGESVPDGWQKIQSFPATENGYFNAALMAAELYAVP